MIAILKRMLTPLFRSWKPCTSCREGFPTYPRRDVELKNRKNTSQVDLIYCEFIEGHAGRHRGMNIQIGKYWCWDKEREPLTSSEEIIDGVVHYDVIQMWDERKDKLIHVVGLQ